MKTARARSSSAPGPRKYPGHRIETRPAGARVRVTFNGEVIADSLEAIVMEESGRAAVYYLPRRDVKMERLTRTTNWTYCPFKGGASYYTLSSGWRRAEDAAWSYEEPYDEMAAIKDRLAFYPGKVDAITAQPE